MKNPAYGGPRRRRNNRSYSPRPPRLLSEPSSGQLAAQGQTLAPAARKRLDLERTPELAVDLWVQHCEAGVPLSPPAGRIRRSRTPSPAPRPVYIPPPRQSERPSSGQLAAQDETSALAAPASPNLQTMTDEEQDDYFNGLTQSQMDRYIVKCGYRLYTPSSLEDSSDEDLSDEDSSDEDSSELPARSTSVPAAPSSPDPKNNDR